MWRRTVHEYAVYEERGRPRPLLDIGDLAERGLETLPERDEFCCFHRETPFEACCHLLTYLPTVCILDVDGMQVNPLG